MTQPNEPTDDVMPWSEIGRRLRMPVQDVRREYDSALAKLRTAMEEQNVTVDDVRAYLRHADQDSTNRERLIQYLNLYHPESVDPRAGS